MSDSDAIVVEQLGDVAVLRLNRPAKLNALDEAARENFIGHLQELGDGTGPRGIVITGTGRSFSSGEDLTETVAEHIDLAASSFHDITRALVATKVPTAAAINGLAVGGCAEMLLSVDARIGCENTSFLLPENGRGLVVSNAASYLLFRLLRATDAYRLVLDGERISAASAHRMGLVDELVPAEGLLQHAADKLARWTRAGHATMQHLSLLRPPIDEVEAAMERETAAVLDAHAAGLVERGIAAFLARP